MKVSIVIPTKNRAYTLKTVLPSYLNQKYVHEIIIIDDGGDDNTSEVVASFMGVNPDVDIRCIRHETSLGAAAGRITGYTNAVYDYVLFGEDDAYLGTAYVSTLLSKLEEKNCAIVSGQIIYMEPQETIDQASKRFGNGLIDGCYINYSNFMINTDVKLTEDLSVVFTHALFLTKKCHLLKYGYDPIYGKGNGFREETDFQIACFCDDLDVLVTPDTKCYHMSRKDVKAGGQRVSNLTQIYYAVANTNYLYKKYYKKLSKRLGLNRGRSVALLKFIYSFVFKRYTLAVLKKLGLPQ